MISGEIHSFDNKLAQEINGIMSGKGVHPDELFGILKPRNDIKIKDFNEIRKITEEHYDKE
jgi:hypothetical protein